MRTTKVILGLIVLLQVMPHAFAGNAALLVEVNGAKYLVNGSTVTSLSSNKPLGKFTRRKASFTAQVLDKQILHSSSNRKLFSAPSRAAIFADQSSGHFVEPWRRVLASSRQRGDGAAFNAAKSEFKAWSKTLANDPKALALAAVRIDYRASIGAYRENATIYRGVMRHGAILNYRKASRFLQNEMLTYRLALVKTLEQRLSGSRAAASDISMSLNPKTAKQLGQMIREKVIDQIDSAKDMVDLEVINSRVKRTALAEIPPLKAYRDSIRPAKVRLNSPASNAVQTAAPSANESSVTAKEPAQAAGKETVTVVGPSKKARIVNVVGAAKASTGQQTTLSNNHTSGSTPNASVPAPDKASGSVSANAGAAGGSQVNKVSTSGRITGHDPLHTYSSIEYTTSDGWKFDPSTGLWRNPKDPTQTRIPAIITCCDKSGLAFPNDAIEAQTSYWDERGYRDPNCGRLYRCSNEKPAKVGATANGSRPTDKDEEIHQAINYIKKQFPPLRDLTAKQYIEEFNALRKFTASLKGDYRRRAEYLFATKLRIGRPPQHVNLPSVVLPTGSAPCAPVNGNTIHCLPRPIVSGKNAQQAKAPADYRSRITGTGGIESKYEPITKKRARQIFHRYKSIPGGIALEGAADGLSFVKSVTLDSKDNVFILNDDLIYPNPISVADFSEIKAALAKDNNLGVSLGDNQLVYGAVPPHTTVVLDLKVADQFLAAIVFGNPMLLKGYRLAPGYLRMKAKEGHGGVFFRIHGFRLTPDASGQIERTHAELTTTLIPTQTKNTIDGGSKPDIDKIDGRDLAKEYGANVKNFQDNIAYYGRERIVRHLMAYGEAASFARTMRDRKIEIKVQ